MRLEGSLDGGIEFVGGGSDVEITPTLSSGTKIADFTIDETSGSLYAPNSLIETVSSPLVLVGKDLRVDLSNYYTKSEMQIELQTYQRRIESIDDQLIISGTFNNQLSLSFDIDNYQEKLTAGTGIDITNNTISTDFDISDYQPKLTAGTGIDITNNVISATGGSGGSSWDIPTDGTPLAIGTFGSQTLYVQSVSVSANTYALCRFWTGQAGDIVLSANAIAVSNGRPAVKMVVPASITNIVSFSWRTDDYEANPHLSIYSTLDSNLWSRGATIKGMVIFAR